MQDLKLVKNLAFGDTARGQVLTGVEKLTNAVGSTLGASGKCVIIEDSNGTPQITKDGVTVANSITLHDPLENIGATLIKQAAQKTVDDAGDGTTTATVLAKAILDEAESHSLLDDERAMREGINSGVNKVIKYLEKSSKKVTGKKIDQVATISANNDVELGKTIGKAFKMVDETGVVMMEKSEDETTYVELVEGFQFNRGLRGKHFLTDKVKHLSVLDNPLVLIVENKIENIRKIQGVLEHVIKKGRSLLIIADVDRQVETSLAMNVVKGNIKVNILEAPIYGVSKADILEDLCAVTGATLVNENLGDQMDLITPDMLGTCSKSVTNSKDTILKFNGSSENVKSLIDRLVKYLETLTNKNTIAKVEKRIANLKSKLAIVKVGANSEMELNEKLDRVEDAICATKAAIKEGIVPGGGIALLNANMHLEPTCMGEEVLYQAIRKPYELILSNAGVKEYVDPDEDNRGLNVVTGNTVDMVKAGIIDPLLVTKSALKNAASVATTILSTDCVINNIRA
jgi:chaperonin GroEL